MPIYFDFPLYRVRITELNTIYQQRMEGRTYLGLRGNRLSLIVVLVAGAEFL